MAWTPFCFIRLIATCKGSHRPAEAVNCKRRASKTQIKARAHRRNFDCLFLLLEINRLKKSIEIPRSRLLQFAARAIHCPMSRKVFLSSRSREGASPNGRDALRLGALLRLAPGPEGDTPKCRRKIEMSPCAQSRDDTPWVTGRRRVTWTGSLQ